MRHHCERCQPCPGTDGQANAQSRQSRKGSFLEGESTGLTCQDPCSARSLGDALQGIVAQPNPQYCVCTSYTGHTGRTWPPVVVGVGLFACVADPVDSGCSATAQLVISRSDPREGLEAPGSMGKLCDIGLQQPRRFSRWASDVHGQRLLHTPMHIRQTRKFQNQRPTTENIQTLHSVARFSRGPGKGTRAAGVTKARGCTEMTGQTQDGTERAPSRVPPPFVGPDFTSAPAPAKQPPSWRIPQRSTRDQRMNREEEAAGPTKLSVSDEPMVGASPLLWISSTTVLRPSNVLRTTRGIGCGVEMEKRLARPPQAHAPNLSTSSQPGRRRPTIG